MPDLGQYATEVLAAYGASFLLLGGLIGLSWRRYQWVKKALAEIEKNG